MALRTIRTYKDEILRKKSRKVDVINNRIKILIEDMLDTMYDADGVGLAAPQIGILKRVIVVDIADGAGAVALINPEILYRDGLTIEEEGCLSVPGEVGSVERPKIVRIRALNEAGETVEIEAEDLFARALCHEIDHLDGILFTDKVIESEEK
ncbi:MAG: peptide deformylase [Clostridiaceae bacterium]|nr:peptide deformylase [Clostridiaceae bacterium]